MQNFIDFFLENVKHPQITVLEGFSHNFSKSTTKIPKFESAVKKRKTSIGPENTLKFPGLMKSGGNSLASG